MKISSSHGLKAGDTEDICCVICRDYLHVSAAVCSCCHRPVCVRHVNQQCECPMSSRTLLYRFTLAELYDIRDQSADTSQQSMDIDKPSTGTKRGVHRERCESQGLAKFVAFLDQWKLRAESVLDADDVNSSEMDTLLYEAMQFLWGGHEVDPLRSLYARLRDSIDWYNGLNRLGHGSDAKITVEELNGLINKTPHPSDHPGVLRLKEMRKEVQDWILETERVLHPSGDIELDMLTAFYDKGQKMNVLLPGLNLIKERVADACALQQSIHSVFHPTPSTPLQDVDELKTLHRRTRDLKICFDDCRQLEAFLSMIDGWIEMASSKQDSMLTLDALRGLLNEVSCCCCSAERLRRVILSVGRLGSLPPIFRYFWPCASDCEMPRHGTFELRKPSNTAIRFQPCKHCWSTVAL